MTMPLYAWAAYLRRAVIYQNADTMRMAIAASFPHMEQSDRSRIIRDLEEESRQIVDVTHVQSKEEYVAMLTVLGIGTELN